jgi:hypothetical protein
MQTKPVADNPDKLPDGVAIEDISAAAKLLGMEEKAR